MSSLLDRQEEEGSVLSPCPVLGLIGRMVWLGYRYNDEGWWYHEEGCLKTRSLAVVCLKD